MYHLSPTTKPLLLLNLLRYFQEYFPLIIVLNIPRDPRSTGSTIPTNVRYSFPTLSINIACVYLITIYPVYLTV